MITACRQWEFDSMKGTLILELRKQRAFFLGAAGALALGFAAAVIVLAAFTGWTFGEALVGAGVLLAVSTPVIACVTGSAGAARLHQALEKSSDEALPASTTGRVFGAYLVGLFYFSVLALLCLQWLGLGSVFAVAWAWLQSVLYFFPWIFAGLVQIHCLAFLLAYRTRLTFLSASLALILTLLQAYLFRLSLVFSNIDYHTFLNLNRYPIQPATTFTHALLVIAVAGGWGALSIALWMLAGRMEKEQRVGLFRNCIFVFAVFSGFLFSIAALNLGVYQLNRSADLLMPIGGHGPISQNQPASEPFTQGSIWRTLGGAIVWIGKDGSKRTVYVAPHPTAYGVASHSLREMDLMEYLAFQFEIIDCLVTQNGEVWLLIRPDTLRWPTRFQVLKIQPGGSGAIFTEFSGNASSLQVLNKSVAISGWDGNRPKVASLTEPGKAPEWRPNDPGDPALRQATEEVRSEVLSYALAYADSQTRWSLPSNSVVTQVPLNGSAGSTKQGSGVVIEKGLTEFFLVFYLPDKSILIPGGAHWESPCVSSGNMIQDFRIPGGGVAWRSNCGALVVAAPNHSIYDSWKMEEIYAAAGFKRLYHNGQYYWDQDAGYKIFRRISSSRLWLLLNSTLLQIDLATKKVIRRTDLASPKDKLYASSMPSTEGIYYSTKSFALRYVDWDGQIHELGPAYR